MGWMKGRIYFDLLYKFNSYIRFFIIPFYFTISTILFLTLPVSKSKQTKKAVNNIEILLYCIINLDFNKPTVL